MKLADVGYVLLGIAFVFGPSVVCWLKGKRRWAVIGFFTLWHWIPTFRLAKPDSWWALHFYGQEKTAGAHQRYASQESSRGRSGARGEAVSVSTGATVCPAGIAQACNGTGAP